MTIAAMNAYADRLVAAKLTYNQLKRWQFRNGDKINPGAACDCSSSDGAIAKAGYPNVDLTGTFYTGNFASKLKAAGFSVLRFAGLATVKVGDFLLTPGHHVAYKRSETQMWSAESPGNVGYRKPYIRPGGWTYIVRPPAEAPALHRFNVGFASQQNKRFGGLPSDSIARVNKLHDVMNLSLFGITEGDSIMERAILKRFPGHNSVKLSTGTVIVFYKRNAWDFVSSRETLHGDNYHGALCVALRDKVNGKGLDFIVNHSRPKTVATPEQKREDAARALALVGTWDYVMVGDFAMDIDGTILTPRVGEAGDTYDAPGVQDLDAMFTTVGIVSAKKIDPGTVADHTWITGKLIH